MNPENFRIWKGKEIQGKQLQCMCDDVEAEIDAVNPMKQEGTFLACRFAGDTAVVGIKDYGGAEIIICKVVGRWADYDAPVKQNENLHHR